VAKHRLAGVGARRRKHCGWGFEDQQLAPAQMRASAETLSAHLAIAIGEVEEPAALDSAGIINPGVLIDPST
jgi:hypothetical protein